ncbi:MAG: HNH endonuclease [Chloroflexi bacterium]|nr:HNH endonuclease [Chloroflexota bacterium]
MGSMEYDIDLREAALYLKMPPLTVLRCIRYAPRPNGGLKLHCQDRDGATYFCKSDLDAFLSDLKEPWVNNPTSKRPDIPSYFKEALRLESSLRCGLCGSPYATEFAHIIPWEKCYHHHPWNLISLCPTCHTGYDKEKRISVDEIERAKNRAQELLIEELQSFGFGHKCLERLKMLKVSINGTYATGIDVLISSIDPNGNFLYLRKCRVVELLKMLGDQEMRADPESTLVRLAEVTAIHLSLAQISQPFWDDFARQLYEFKLFPDVIIDLSESGKELIQRLRDYAERYIEVEKFTGIQPKMSALRVIELVSTRCQKISDYVDSRARLEDLELNSF